MTNKEQIIIDGVDVSKCEFLIKNEYENLCRCIKSNLFGGIEFVKNAEKGHCQDNPNCYFKQLVRKTQECEEILKSWSAHLELWKDDLLKENERLKQECEELEKNLKNEKKAAKIEIETYNNSCLQLQQENDELYLERNVLNTANSGLNSVLEMKEQELNRYRKALEPFQDEYFKGLDTTVIAELAKKSIRLTKENRNLETALEEIEKVYEITIENITTYDEQNDINVCIGALHNISDIINNAKGEGNEDT